jgi:hypothetical protein
MTKKLNVIKVPLPPNSKKDYPKAFPRMPILYLELVENKSRVKPELVNTDYIPGQTIAPSRPAVKETFEASDSEAEKSPAKIEFESSDGEKSDEQSIKSESDMEEPFSEDGSADEEIPQKKPSRKESTGSSSESGGSDKGKKNKISFRLKELLEDDKVEEHFSPDTRSGAKDDLPPSLGDLAKSGQISRKKEMMDIGHLAMNEQEKEDAKRELLFKFELLKKSYKTDNIPEFSAHSDYDTMKRAYESTVRTLSLDKAVDDYKKYLAYAFIGMEFILGYVFKLDMNGFARQQMISMSSYERLLIELGEKSYVPTGSKWSVEIRLLFLVVMNTAVFLVGRMMLKKTGADVMGLVNSMNGSTQTTGGIPQKKRKMKGPSLNVDDIPDINDTAQEN